MYGIEVSTGFLAGLAPEAAGHLSGFVEALKARLVRSPLVHVDETSTQVGTATWWLHVVSSSDATHLFADRTRGKDAPDAVGVLAPKVTYEPNRRLLAHLKNERQVLFTFLAHPGVPATNHEADRAIRPQVVTRKAWGCNKSLEGAAAGCASSPTTTGRSASGAVPSRA